jgi:Spy/CpxP family protein refolding chaperone
MEVKMRIKILIGILILLIAVNLGTLGSYLYMEFFKKTGPSEWERPPRPHFRPLDRPELQLDREQRKQLRNLLKEIHQESQSLRKQLWETEKSTFVLLQHDTLSMKQIDENLKLMADPRIQMIRIAILKMQQAKSFLSAEQQEHFFNAIMMARPGFPDAGKNMTGRPPRPGFGPNWKHFDSLKRGEKNE